MAVLSPETQPSETIAQAETTLLAPENNHLLLHICCGPCACICIKTLLAEGWRITGYYMNPNIQPLAEYLRRREAAVQCAEHFGIALICDDQTWNITHWLRAVQNRDTAPERCHYCVSSRMEATAAKASELGCTHFSSSLLYSKYQPHAAIREAGAGAPPARRRGFGP